MDSRGTQLTCMSQEQQGVQCLRCGRSLVRIPL